MDDTRSIDRRIGHPQPPKRVEDYALIDLRRPGQDAVDRFVSAFEAHSREASSRLGVMRNLLKGAETQSKLLSTWAADNEINRFGSSDVFSYAGSNILCTIYVPSYHGEHENDEGFIEIEDHLQTITVSSARSVMPVRRLGETNPAAYTRGSRTIAGSMVFTTGLKDAFVKMLAKSFKDGEPRNEGTLFVDQIPKFSMIFECHNELGGASSAMLVNMTLTNFGTTFSVDDIYTESTFTYVAEQYFPIAEYGDRKKISGRLVKIMSETIEKTIGDAIDGLATARGVYAREADLRRREKIFNAKMNETMRLVDEGLMEQERVYQQFYDAARYELLFEIGPEGLHMMNNPDMLGVGVKFRGQGPMESQASWEISQWFRDIQDAMAEHYEQITNEGW